MNEFKSIKIITTTTSHAFIGKHLPDRQRPNWHYYQDKDGSIIHCRKEHMVMVIEKDIVEKE